MSSASSPPPRPQEPEQAHALVEQHTLQTTRVFNLIHGRQESIRRRLAKPRPHAGPARSLAAPANDHIRIGQDGIPTGAIETAVPCLCKGGNGGAGARFPARHGKGLRKFTLRKICEYYP
jgi:hypothetical protein